MLIDFKKQLENKGEIYFRFKVKPNAGKTEIKEANENQTRIYLKAPPIQGKANQELIKYLAKEFKVNKNNVKIISGTHEKIKLIKIIK